MGRVTGGTRVYKGFFLRIFKDQVFLFCKCFKCPGSIQNTNLHRVASVSIYMYAFSVYPEQNPKPPSLFRVLAAFTNKLD